MLSKLYILTNNKAHKSSVAINMFNCSIGGKAVHIKSEMLLSNNIAFLLYTLLTFVFFRLSIISILVHSITLFSLSLSFF